MEEQTQLWKKSELQNRLRRPRDAAANSAPKQVNNAEQKTDGRSSANTQKLLNNATSEEPTETKFDSRLSADAQEFVPANYQTTSKKSSAQERLLKIKTDDEMQQDKSRVDQDVRRLDNVITTLTYDPGQFDDLLDLFVETFKPYIEDQEFIDIVAEMLFRKGTQQPNFTYTGARLCKIMQEISPLFRAALTVICTRQLNNKVNLQGLTIFLGELYSQLHYNSVYGTNLLNAMEGLLIQGDDASIKCLCQILKLAGYSLSRFNTKAIDDIFNKLASIRGDLGPSTAALLNAVVKLKEEGWGVVNNLSSDSSSSSAGEDNSCWVDDQTVFYNPNDGTMLTADEKVFFADHLQPDFNLEEEEVSDPDELYDPEPEMDEEIQAAFKEFLKLSKQ